MKRGRIINKADLAEAFVEYIYPLHYQVGKALEDVMRDGRLTRQQVAILWLIRSEGIDGRRMLRKELQHLIEGWFDLSSPAITLTLRAMARPPLSLVRLTEAPHSGREQMVALTTKGERFLTTMVENATKLMMTMIVGLPDEDLSTLHALYERLVPLTIQQLQKGNA